MPLTEQPELAGRDYDGMLEYVVTFRAGHFRERVWPAVIESLRHGRFEALAALVAESPSPQAAALLAELRRWRPDCRYQGRYPGDDPFCEHPRAACRARADQGSSMCGMKDCFRRLTKAVLELCRPAAGAGELLADAAANADALCEVLAWAIEDEEHGVALFGSPVAPFPAELDRTSMSVYLTHWVDEPQVGCAARTAAACRDRLRADLELTDGELDGLGAFWRAAAEAGVGLALCYAEP